MASNAPENRLHLHRLHCAVCNHVDRDEIDEKLRSGVMQKTIMAEYGLSKDSVMHHVKAMRLFHVELAEKKQMLGKVLWRLSGRMDDIIAALEPKEAATLMLKAVEQLAKIDGDMVSRSQQLPPDFREHSEAELKQYIADAALELGDNATSDATVIEGTDTVQ